MQGCQMERVYQADNDVCSGEHVGLDVGTGVSTHVEQCCCIALV